MDETISSDPANINHFMYYQGEMGDSWSVPQLWALSPNTCTFWGNVNVLNIESAKKQWQVLWFEDDSSILPGKQEFYNT